MLVFELVIALLLVGAVLAAVARRLNIPYPALLALAGAGLALVPNAPSVMLDPRLALTLLVAPVLLDTAFDSSPRDLKQNWRAVASLALTAVGLTVAAVAIVARWLMPSLPWPAAIALGAIVAPPDAAAAIAVLRHLRAPHRVFVILEGESLFNDATALLIYRLALTAAVTGSFSGWHAIPVLLVVTLGSIGLGAVLSRVIQLIIPRIQDVPISVIVQFLSTFAVWMLADWLGLSGIITLVVFAILVARTAPDLMPARLRIPSYAVWEVVVFVLNVLAFILIGLQLRPILDRLSGSELLSYTAIAAAVCVAVVVVRIVWVMGYAGVLWLTGGRADRASDAEWRPSLRGAAVVAWCGMRGIVTIAAALALPSDFTHRDLIVFTAFCVVLVTLVLQGMTVRPLMRALALQADNTVEREVRLARAETARAGLDAVEGVQSTDDMVALLRRKYEARISRAESGVVPSGSEGDGAPAAGYLAAQRRAHQAERRMLSDLRARGVIGDDAFHRVEEELDWAEVNVEAMTRRE
jgi:CPA1 family monovalent cation:H+ antiporter